MLQVVDYGPQAWFLLTDGEALLLEARCSSSAVDYSWLIELSEEERATLLERGHPYLDELADAIHHSAPASQTSKSRYKDRNLDHARAAEVTAAIRAWMAPPR
ncbi:hypothetical protein BH09PSE6_BH09PSE6_03270 [soil metagenome]